MNLRGKLLDIVNKSDNQTLQPGFGHLMESLTHVLTQHLQLHYRKSDHCPTNLYSYFLILLIKIKFSSPAIMMEDLKNK